MVDISPFERRKSFILHEKASRHYWQGRGLLSVKMFLHGRALYNTGVGSFSVNDSSFLVLNEGQSYSITIDSETPVESFCLFFEKGLIDDIYCSLTAKDPGLLDNPSQSISPIAFIERTYIHDDLLSPKLFRLRKGYLNNSYQPGWLDEQFRDILEALLRVHQYIRNEIDCWPSPRPAVRQELYRRMHLARDYACAHFREPVTLTELSRIACMSPNHFLRTFKKTFQQSPHQYLTALRLKEASRQLLVTDMSVTDICMGVGYSSLGSFSSLFRREFGLSPQRFRVNEQKR